MKPDLKRCIRTNATTSPQPHFLLVLTQPPQSTPGTSLSSTGETCRKSQKPKFLGIHRMKNFSSLSSGMFSTKQTSSKPMSNKK